MKVGQLFFWKMVGGDGKGVKKEKGYFSDEVAFSMKDFQLLIQKFWNGIHLSSNRWTPYIYYHP